MPGKDKRKVHIMGIGGTFMCGIARLAREMELEVEGTDRTVIYPPMSTQLDNLHINVRAGYHPENLSADCDEVIIGNAITRGMPLTEMVLNRGLPYTSGADWLAANILSTRDTITVAGTHGKTTTSSLIAFLLDEAGRDPGFLIGGVPKNFGVSARMGRGSEFVVEGDEYDTAFFDKRSKFVHYKPVVAVLNNLEFDHADIFENLAAIQKQFHHLVRTVPGRGKIIVNGEDKNLKEVIDKGCWTPMETFGVEDQSTSYNCWTTDYNWKGRLIKSDGSHFQVFHDGKHVGNVRWNLIGRHNVMNALGALAALNAIGVSPEHVLDSFSRFESVQRRLELLATVGAIAVYDDFAHHPTAIRTTLKGLRERIGEEPRIIVVVEPSSYTMKSGIHEEAFSNCFEDAQHVIFYRKSDIQANIEEIQSINPITVCKCLEELLNTLKANTSPGDHIVFMSNGGFDDAQKKFIELLERS